MKKSILGIILLILTVVNSCSCSLQNTKIKGNYLTFTTTYQSSSKSYFSKNYVYDLKTKEIKKMGEVECNAGYPVTVYDKWDNAIYYAYRGTESNVNHYIQVYKYDLETGEKKRITDTLCAINFIIPLKDKIFAGCGDMLAENQRIKAFTISKKGHKVSSFFDMDDFQMNNVSYNPDLKEFQLIGQSYSYLRDKVVGSSQMDNVRITQVNYKVDMEGKLLSTESFDDLEITGAYVENKEYAVYRLHEGSGYNMTVYLLNKDTQEITEITEDISHKSLIYIDKQNILYYIGAEFKDGGVKETINTYNIETKEVNVIFTPDEGDLSISNAFVTG